MTNFIAYKKDTGEIIRTQYGWNGEFNQDIIDMIIEKDYSNDNNIAIMIVDDIDIPISAKVLNGKITA